MSNPRTLVVVCPDWPIRALGLDGAAAVIEGGRVVACSPEARAEGVRPGQRRRQAEAACPGLAVASRDRDREARAFEPVVAAVAAFCPVVEVARPGRCALAVRRPARYFGGEAALVRALAAAVAPVGGESGIGVADGTFAATLAAHRNLIVAPGRTAEFLAPLPVEALGQPELADLLGRLGINTLGQLAALPGPQVLARFGWEGAAAHRLAQGRDDRPLDARRPPEDLTAAAELDPPVERVDQAAFAAKALADRLHAALAERFLRCTLVRIEAESEHGETISRCWRHDGSFTATALAERLRWQLEGWLLGDHRPTGGISNLRLVPEEVVPDQGVQEGFWGGMAEGDRRAARALARVQGLLGPEGVVVPVVGGGRGPADRTRYVPWGDERTPARPEAPWPGRVPPPAPAVVGVGRCATVLDAAGRPVVVGGRGELRGTPSSLVLSGEAGQVTAWSAPWPCHERWWDPGARRRRAWMQVATADGRAYLLVAQGGGWSVEGFYD